MLGDWEVDRVEVMVGVMVLEILEESVDEEQALAQEVMLGEKDTVWVTERVCVTLLV